MKNKLAPETTTLERLAAQLSNGFGHRRRIVAIAGAPGAGKSTFAEALRNRFNRDKAGICEILPMDGYHYDDTFLGPMGWQARKGAPHTFDVGGLSAILARLKDNQEPEISVPVFDRELEISRAGARLINQCVELIVVEGNYLLLNKAPWSGLRPAFDVTIMLDVPIETLAARLRARWEGLGYSKAEADLKVAQNDLLNAKEVIETSISADYVVKAEG